MAHPFDSFLEPLVLLTLTNKVVIFLRQRWEAARVRIEGVQSAQGPLTGNRWNPKRWCAGLEAVWGALQPCTLSVPRFDASQQSGLLPK